MAVRLVVAAAGGAIVTLLVYQRAAAGDPSALMDNMIRLRQATAVWLAVGQAIWSVMDALQMIFRPGRIGPIGGRPSGRMIGETAAEAAGEY